MLGIIKKDFLYYLGYFVLTAWSPISLTVLDGFTGGTVMMCGGLMLAMPLAAMALIEIMEDKSKGYDFLRCLPLLPIEITSAKLLMPLFSMIIWLVYSFIVLSWGEASSDFMALSYGYIILCAVFALIVIGISYNLIFKFGLTRILKIMILILPVILMIGPGVIKATYRQEIHQMDTGSLVNLASGLNLSLMLLITIALFALLTYLASKSLRARTE